MATLAVASGHAILLAEMCSIPSSVTRGTNLWLLGTYSVPLGFGPHLMLRQRHKVRSGADGRELFAYAPEISTGVGNWTCTLAQLCILHSGRYISAWWCSVAVALLNEFLGVLWFFLDGCLQWKHRQTA